MHREEIEQYTDTTYYVSPEYLWKIFPEFAVYRHPENRKWFAILMNPTWEELHLPKEGKVDILDVKCPPELRAEHEGKPGVLPACHMNKAHWITILADGTVSEDVIRKFLQAGFTLAE